MYQVQVKDEIDNDWRSHGEPTVSYTQARAAWANLMGGTCYDARIICVDNAAGE